MCLQYTNLYFFSPIYDDNPGNKNKEKGNSAGLTWESHLHCFADEFLITHAHSFGTDSQGWVKKVWFAAPGAKLYLFCATLLHGVFSIFFENL